MDSVILYRCFCFCVPFLHNEHVRQANILIPAFNVTSRSTITRDSRPHAASVLQKIDLPATHSSYYSLSPGTDWGYNILPDRKRREEEVGGRERKDSSKTRRDKRDRERREVVTVRGQGRGEDVDVTEGKGRGTELPEVLKTICLI